MRSKPFLCQKWQTEIPEGFACPFPPINVADFVGRERVISGNPANKFGSGFGSSTKLLHEVINPISVPNDYLNTVFDDVVSLCGSCRKKLMPSHGLHRKTLKLVAILSVCVKRFSLQAKVAPSNRNIFTQIVRRALNAISDRNKTKTQFALRF